MNKSFHFWLINFVLSAFFMSCERNENIGIGLKPENSLLNSKVIDTFTVKFHTVFEEDKIISEGTNTLLAGKYIDPKTGATTASSSFQLVPVEDYSITPSSICDSAILTLRIYSYRVEYNDGTSEIIHHYYGDSTNTLSYSIHELTDDILLAEEKTYYTTDVVNYDATPLTSSTPKNIYPGTDTVINFNLGTIYGQKVLDEVEAYQGDNYDFVSKIKGLHIRPSAADNGSCIGFHEISSYTKLKLYYHLDENADSLELTISDIARSFNTITSDFTGTEISSLQNAGDTVSSSSSSNQMFFQSSNGVRTLMTIPYFDKFLEENPIILINNVSLELKIDSSSTTGGFADAPPGRVALFETENNLLVRNEDDFPTTITNEGDYNGSGRGNPYFDFDETNNVYSINLGLYTQQFVNERRGESYDFVIGSYTEGANVSRAILNDESSPYSKTTFKVYYTIPTQE